MNDILSHSINLHLSEDLETEGFDLQAGESWIYPTNYSVREYQFNIIQKALLKNTLVSLPTGLGKTFIAAVVMFNYFRWYPKGKVVFMAPTRPLVKQQIDACYDIMGIPKEATAEITGQGTKSNAREETWNEKRVFFITPQILQNDLDKFDTLGPKIKCLVFDEAHRARGNHAYCEVIRKLSTTNKYFRVLALSATPGGTIEDVLDVVQNLLISHLEFRTEESLDVNPYVFQRNLTTIVVPLGDKLQQVKDEYMKVLEYYTRTLKKYKVIQGNCANLTKGKMFMLTKSFQQKNKGTSPNYGEIMKCLNISITLYHGSELLIRHGLRSFLSFFDEHIEKPLIRSDTMIRGIMLNVREYLGPAPQIQTLPDGTTHTEISAEVKFGHPKFYKLRDILIDHFQQSDTSSRVIVFFEYRESVMEAYALLIQSTPIIKPRIFVGQKQGVTQKLQINVVKAFREGSCNVLLSTSIGEEGLDVGEVDLIICFDISNKSPIRIVQRMGRTGRKKDGKIIVLVTEGKEQETLKDCLIHKNNVAFHVLGSKHLANGLNKECPRLIPEGLSPKCEKMFITIKQQPEIKKGGTLKSMLRKLSSKSSEPSFSPDLQIIDVEDRIPKQQLLCTNENIFDEKISFSDIFSKKIEKQRSFQETHKVNNSENCEVFVDLLKIAESRRFNIPMSQISKSTQNKNLKQTDIRNMFFKSLSAKDFDLPSTQVLNAIDIPNISEEKNFGPPGLFREITNYLSICLDGRAKKCRFCPTQIECGKTIYSSSSFVPTWIELDSSVYSSITLDDLLKFEKSLNKLEDQSFQFDESLGSQIPNTPCNKLEATQNEDKHLELEDLIDSSFLVDFCNKSVQFQAPKSLDKLLNIYSNSMIEVNETPQKEIIQNATQVPKNTFSETEVKDILSFFKLDNLMSIFEKDSLPDSQQTITYSPDIFEESITNNQRQTTPIKNDSKSDESCSPIICSYVSKRKIEINSQRVKKSFHDFGSPSLISVSRKNFTSTPLSQKLDKKIDCATPKTTRNTMEEKNNSQSERKGLELEDLFDLSAFGMTPNKNGNASKTGFSEIVSLSDTCKPEDFCVQPKEKSIKSNNDLDTSDLDYFFDTQILSSFKVPCDNNILNLKYMEGTVASQGFKDTETDRKSNIGKPRNSSQLPQDSKKNKIDMEPNARSRPSSPSQLPVTQLISLINKPTQFIESKCTKNIVSKKSGGTQYSKKDVIHVEPNGRSRPSSPSQLPVTQIISLINKTTQSNKCMKNIVGKKSGGTQDSKKDEIDIEPNGKPKPTISPSSVNKSTLFNTPLKKDNLDDDFDFFDFSFIKKPVPKSQSKTHPKLNQSGESSRGSLKISTPVRNKSTINKRVSHSSSASTSVSDSSKKSLIQTFSESEFESQPKSPAWIRSKPVSLKRIVDNNSDDDFETSDTRGVCHRPKIFKKNIDGKNKKTDVGRNTASSAARPKSKKLVEQFIENEAELSFCDKIDVSDDELESGNQNHYDQSFIADETQNMNTQIHAVYLRSVRSPLGPNRFKIPQKVRSDVNVFSQQENIEDDTYLDDSFVVDDEEVESQTELSQLEILERQLEMQRKRKKKPLEIEKPSKRKFVIDSDSD